MPTGVPCQRLFCYFFLRLKKVEYLFLSFLKKIFVTILKVSHSDSEIEGRARVPQSLATGADAKRERATSMHSVAKKNGADRDYRRKKTAGAYSLYVTAVF